jgi:4-oxalocrotonate tautomerase
MPLVDITLKPGKSRAYKTALFDGIYAALRETFNVPEDDRFMSISERGYEDFSFSRSYLGMDRSDDFIILRITVSNTRSLSQKQALYRAIADHLGRDPGVRPDDIFINLIEVRLEDWSFGRGLAQYVETPPVLAQPVVREPLGDQG